MGWIRHVSQSGRAAFRPCCSPAIAVPVIPPVLIVYNFILSPSHFFFSVPSFGFFWGVVYQIYSNSEDFVLSPLSSLYTLGENINFYVFSLDLYTIISKFSSPINTSLSYCDCLAIIAFSLHYIFLKFKMH